MPIYRYESKKPSAGCPRCRDGFEVVQSIKDAALTTCPACGGAIVKTPVAAAVGRSQSNFDDRAKSAGFSKLKRLGKGEYERQY
ncbi:MAG: FmdB family zinc ribbon protein [Kiritimatiellia bacterium]|jgi:putative FmdB family regulatory protein